LQRCRPRRAAAPSHENEDHCRAALHLPHLVELRFAGETVCAFASAAIATGYRDAPEIETSREALLHFEDTTPAAIIGSTGALAVPTRSAFQTDVIAIKVRGRVAWAVAPDGAQVVENVNW
jgi:hypothetical protein